MKRIILLILCLNSFYLFAQTDTLIPVSNIVVHRDLRLDILGRKEAELNYAAAMALARSAMGYRLQVLSTNDRELAMRTKSQLLQKYPEQKTYMWFANPFIKIKFGNFKTKEEAESYKKQISKLLNGATIYYLPETIEVKPDKDFNPDDIN